MVLQLVRPALLLMCSVLATCVRRDKGQGEFCTLGGHRYRVGQTWHPSLAPFGENRCINCTCYKGGEVKCPKIDCPRPDCEEPKILPGECCPVCDVGNERAKKDNDKRPGCQFDGNSFHDGEVFPSNSTGLRPTRPEQCVMCHCAIGKVFCQLKTCLPTKCQKFKSVPNDCCPQCADESIYTDDYLHYILSDPKQDNRTSADCSSPMGLHQNGSSWNPVIGVYGRVECIVCTCLNGDVNCSRLQCPEESSLPCRKPRLRAGSCCKECPGTRRRDRPQGAGGRRRGDGATDARKRRGRKRGRGKKRKNRRKKGRGHRRRKCKTAATRTVHPIRQANSTSVAVIFSALCLPRHTDRLVYWTLGPDRVTLAFDDVSGQSVEMLQWTVKEGQLQATERQLVQAVKVRESVTCNRLVAATNKRGFKKLLKKIDSKLNKCRKRKRRCTSQLLNKLIKRDRRLKPVMTRHLCGE